MLTAPFGWAGAHADGPVDRSYSCPSWSPLPFRSVPYFAPLAFAVFGFEALVPTYDSTAIVSPMLIAWLRVPVVSDGSNAGVGTSKKSHWFAGSRWPPVRWSPPTSRASMQPSPSLSGNARRDTVPCEMSATYSSPALSCPNELMFIVVSATGVELHTPLLSRAPQIRPEQ